MGVLGQNQSPRMNTKGEAIPSLKATLGEIKVQKLVHSLT